MDFSKLKRYPIRKNELLQAWDSADELLLEHLQALDLEKDAQEKTRILILNDAFGALSVAVNHLSRGFSITTYTDSFVSAKAIELNSGGTVVPIHDLHAFTGVYDKVILKLPKNLSFFEDELCHVSAHLRPGSEVMVGAMIKHLPKGAFDLLERVVGKTHTSLAKKKARLIFAPFQKEKVGSPYPKTLKIDSFPVPFVNHSNLFSREKLDIGTRFFLEHIPAGKFSTILDLGCANGIIGIRAQQKNPEANLIFCDDSAMAVESAQVNFQANFPKANAEFVWTNGYENQKAETVDLVLCNPPFHQQMVVSDFIAQQMFEDAKQVLKPGGFMRVIGNSHLQYGNQLKKIFGNSQKIAANAKFMIWDAVKLPVK